ncbi:MAG: extracellular solute-binding protein [Treponema sp.]|nr:extracellular solute-binding protein [Treponema sp.]
MDETLIKNQLTNLKKKKTAAFFTLCFLCLFMLVLCGCDSRDRLYIYNWNYYTPPGVIQKFEQEFNVRVVYDEFASNEDMYAKIMATNRDGLFGWFSRVFGRNYDIVFPSADYVSILIKQNMLEKIDLAQIPNSKNIDPLVLSYALYDSRMEYSVPYYFGAAGVIVNTSRVRNFERSWSIFAREDLRGRMTMLDDMREVMGDALAFLGYSVNTVNPGEIIEARNLINNLWKPNLVKFDADAFGKGFANGDFWVVQGYPEVVYEEIKEDPAMMNAFYFFIPNEGGPAYIDSMCILKNAKNNELAHKFINFIHRPDIYAEFADFFGFPATANIPARDLKKGYSWYSMEDLANVELKIDLGSALDLYNDAWYNLIRVSGE